MWKEFVCVKSRNMAKKLMPWASVILKVKGGYLGFESMNDYYLFKDQ